MAGLTQDILFRLKGDSRDLRGDLTKTSRQISDVEKQTGRASGRFASLSGGAKLLAGGFAAVAATKVVGFLSDAAKNAAEDQKAQDLLALALRNTVGATDAQVDATEAWIDKTQRQTGIADDELRPALGNLVRATGDLDTAQRDMAVAMDIATAKGMPLETVVKAMAKASLGSVGGLAKMGIQVRTATGEFMEYEEILAKATELMGGATQVAAAGAEGKMRRMQIVFDEAKESVGNFVIDGLGRMIQGAQRLGNVFDQSVTGNIEDFEIITGQTADTAAAAVTIMRDYGRTFEELAPHLNLSTEELQKLRDADEEFLTSLGFTNEEVKTFKVQVGQEMVTAARNARDRGMHPLREETEKTTTAMQDFEAEIRSQVDPIFNLTRKINDLDAAQAASGEARRVYGEGSPQHREALRREAEAWLSVKDAQIKAAEEAGLTRESFRTVLRDMRIFTNDEIELILQDFDKANDYKFKDKTIRVRWSGERRGDVGVGMIGHSGGVIPGPRGKEVPILAQAGETLIPLDGNVPAGAAPGSTNIFHIGTLVGAGGMQQLAKIITDEQVKQRRRSGP